MKKLLKFIGTLILVLGFLTTPVHAEWWNQNAANSLVTNTGNGPANADIHVAHCYIGLGTSVPCGGGASGITGAGTANQVSYFTGTHTIASDSGLTYTASSGILNVGTQYNLGGNLFGSQDATNTSDYFGNLNVPSSPAAGNTIGGYGSYHTTATGAGNTIYGAGSGIALTSGLNNVIIGKGAGTGATTGGQLVVIGQGAGTGVITTTTNSSTIIGFGAGTNLTSGTKNTIIGASSFAGTSGVSNTIVGQGSGNSAATSISSTVIVGAGSGLLVTGSNNTILGKGSGVSLTSGSANVIIGEAAGNGSTGTLSSDIDIGVGAGNQQSSNVSNVIAIGTNSGGGTGSISIGQDAGKFSLSGQNVFIGGEVGASASLSSTQDVGIGQNSLQNMTTGNGNVGVGVDALQNITTGNDNTALGLFAGATHSINDFNTYIGYESGENDISGTLNTYIGASAGYGGAGGSSGQKNVIVGVSDGDALTTASNILFLGYHAGNHITSGGNNLYAGYQSGFATTTGTGNTFAGYNSDIASTTLSNSTIFGSTTSAGNFSDVGIFGQGLTATAANQILIGDSNNTTSTAIFFGDGVINTSAGAVTIGTTGGSGADNVGGALNIASGISTGAATPALINFKTSTVGVSSSTPQTLSTRGSIDGVGNLNWGSSSQFVLNNSGKITKQNNDTTVGNGVSTIVGSLSQASQSGATGTFTIGTPNTTGMYDVKVYVVVTTADLTAGTDAVSISWTDTSGSNTYTSTSTLNLGLLGSYVSFNVPVEGIGGDAINFIKTLSGGPGTAQITFRATLDREQ